MANNQLCDNQQVTFQVFEYDKDNIETQPEAGDTVTVVSSDPAAVLVAIDGAPSVAGAAATGWLKGQAKTETGVTITYTVTHADGTSLATTELWDVVPGAATSLTVSHGSPINQ